MKNIKTLLVTGCLAVVLIGIGLFQPDKAYSETTVCPNSSVKCNVTFNHPDYGKITVESEKGKNDSAVTIQ